MLNRRLYVNGHAIFIRATLTTEIIDICIKSGGYVKITENNIMVISYRYANPSIYNYTYKGVNKLKIYRKI